MRCKVPASYKEKEILLRKYTLEHAVRGKIDLSLSIESDKGDDEFGLNKALFKKYYTELKELQDELNITNSDLMQTVMRIPNVVGAVTEDVDEEEWQAVLLTMKEAISALNNFRAEEGRVMVKDLNEANGTILRSLEEVTPFEEGRINTLKDRFRKNLEDFQSDEQVDRNRFEQEIIYYLEKLDINEEKVRLAQHCKFFEEVLNGGKTEIGKKLGFIAQEMGREINTLGAKAQEKNIQRLVVTMKDALEKIKEQLANIV